MCVCVCALVWNDFCLQLNQESHRRTVSDLSVSVNRFKVWGKCFVFLVFPDNVEILSAVAKLLDQNHFNRWEEEYRHHGDTAEGHQQVIHSLLMYSVTSHMRPTSCWDGESRIIKNVCAVMIEEKALSKYLCCLLFQWVVARGQNQCLSIQLRETGASQCVQCYSPRGLKGIIDFRKLDFIKSFKSFLVWIKNVISHNVVNVQGRFTASYMTENQWWAYPTLHYPLVLVVLQLHLQMVDLVFMVEMFTASTEVLPASELLLTRRWLVS